MLSDAAVFEACPPRPGCTRLLCGHYWRKVLGRFVRQSVQALPLITQLQYEFDEVSGLRLSRVMSLQCEVRLVLAKTERFGPAPVGRLSWHVLSISRCLLSVLSGKTLTREVCMRQSLRWTGLLVK